MKYEEKLDITDMVRCAENFYKTLVKAYEIEKETLQATEEARDEAEFFYRLIRAGVIKVFEMTVESSWKMMQRRIKINSDNIIHQKPKRELFRTAHQCGLISDPVAWWEFYEGRNKTAHVYHEETAEEVYIMAKKFNDCLEDFMERLALRI